MAGKSWEYMGDKFETKKMNFHGKQGWECYAINNGWAYFKRPVYDKGNTTGITYKKKEKVNEQ